MKTRFLFLTIIAIVSVGCSAFFEFQAESSDSRLDEDAPADSTFSEKDSELRTSDDKVEEPILMDAVDSDGYAMGSTTTGGGGAAYGGGGDSAAGSEMAESDFTVAGAERALAPAPPITGEPSTVASSAPIVEAQQVATLKAGEIDDNAEWDDYLLYRRESLENFGDWVNDVDVSGRRIITVTDANGLPILGATVTVAVDDKIISRTRTYANGQTLLLPNANPDNQSTGNMVITIEKDDISSVIDMSLVRMAGPNWEFGLDTQLSRESVKLDVMFLLDATGSMADEITQLQENILSISQQIDNMGDVDVRYGLVHYRDRGNEAYITQVNDFTSNVTTFQAELSRVRADGGGDTPESLNAGLHDALQTVEWRGDDTIKLVFLVADAPPHLDYPNDYNYADEMLYAGERGIKIHPIASSGLDPVGEYIFRQIGQTTMGRFIFLTYADGTPGEAGDERPDLEASTQDYTVDFLDGLVVRLVEEEINAFKGLIEDED